MTEVLDVAELLNSCYANEKQLQRVVTEVCHNNAMAPCLFNSRS
jgi:hypothetical protein